MPLERPYSILMQMARPVQTARLEGSRSPPCGERLAARRRDSKLKLSLALEWLRAYLVGRVTPCAPTAGRGLPALPG